MREILLKLSRRQDLTRAEAEEAFHALMSGAASEAQIGGLLVGLAGKGSTVDELSGAAEVLRKFVQPIPVNDPGGVVDTCGTGGDGKGTFNISTAAAIVAAACGARVVKHGNRSASGKTGSADVLEALGVKLEADPQRLADGLEQCGICFAFARHHHPAMRHVAAARSSLGIPTIFNILGPLANPAGAKRQVLGVFAPELTDRLATVLQILGSDAAWVVHGEDGLDEISTLAPTRVSELRNGRIQTWTLNPRDFGIEYARLSDLQVDNTDESADVIRQILRGQSGPPRDIVVLNAAATVVVAGLEETLQAAISRAKTALDSGKALQTLDLLVRISQS
jgi:anthranilate phosphoribosyltransferase